MTALFIGAVVNWPDVEGRMVREHVDVDAVLNEPLYVLAGLLLSYAIDDVVSWQRPRIIARRVVMWQLQNPRKVPTEEDLERSFDDDDDVDFPEFAGQEVPASRTDDPAPVRLPTWDEWDQNPRAKADNARALKAFG